ncbi:MAG TPA: HlyC/CorC family transporter [Cyanobacteria bacterium UBA8156]|jgi:putative hemolysin|nr:HlyC/CorC family transporter [Cyanobacteria bacterium UBA8156]
MEDLPGQLFGIAILVGINAFFAASEIALISASEARIQALLEQGDRRARLVQRAVENSTQFLATVQVGVTLAGFFASATAATELAGPLDVLLSPFVGRWAAPLSLVLVTFAVAVVTLVFGELVPKKLALHHAEAIALFTAEPIYWLERLASPLVRFLSAFTNGILALTGTPVQGTQDVRVEEIKAMVDAARAGGAVGEQERRIIYRAVELPHIEVRAIMVPRVQIQYLSVNTTLAETFAVVAENAHTRLPVCDGDLDTIVGILHVKDLIRPMDHQLPSLRELLRPVYYISEHHLTGDLLRDMQKNRLHLAIVQDEFGGTAGLVTLEDVLEELVGEIRDEYDAEEEREFRRVSTSEGIFKLRASIGTVNNELDLVLPREDFATLLGLFLDELQRAPIAGDRIEVEGVELTVLEDGQRVRVRKIPAPEGHGDTF